MEPDEKLVIVVSKLGEREKSFFSRWGMEDPDTSPFVRYIGKDASECLAPKSVMVLLQGDLAKLPDRIVLAMRATGRTPDSSFLLIHTGDAQEMRKAIAGKSASDDYVSEWAKLIYRSFSLRSDREPYLIIRHEIAHYAASRQNTKYWKAFLFLNQALSQALSLHQGGSEKSETRSRTAAEHLDSQTNRMMAGLPGTKPRPPVNPISALIHEAVSRFDALLIDFQTSLADAAYWEEAKGRYKDSTRGHVDKLKVLLTESHTGMTDIEPVADIATRISQSDRLTDEDRSKLVEITADLKEMFSNGIWQSTFDLLNAINEGTHGIVVRSDYDALRLWLSTVRQKLTSLDDLFRKSRPPMQIRKQSSRRDV